MQVVRINMDKWEQFDRGVGNLLLYFCHFNIDFTIRYLKTRCYSKTELAPLPSHPRFLSNITVLAALWGNHWLLSLPPLHRVRTLSGGPCLTPQHPCLIAGMEPSMKLFSKYWHKFNSVMVQYMPWLYLGVTDNILNWRRRKNKVFEEPLKSLCVKSG